MSPVPVSPRRVFGVDFSAARDAGKHIWVCRAHPGADGIRIESVDPLAELPGGVVPRDDAFRALVQKVIESPRSAWGFDFSFALPVPVLETAAPALGDYAEQLAMVTGFEDADGLRRWCNEAAGDRELRRRADDEASTPFSPYNLRIYKQTYHGMVDVLRPLRERPEVAVLPFDQLPDTATDPGNRLPFHHAAGGRAPHIYLMEVCPASVLAALHLPVQGYKGDDGRAAAKRHSIFGRLAGDGLVRPTRRALRNRIVEEPEGNALDAVLAAVGAWRGYRNYDHSALRADPRYGVEGFVYT